MALAASLCGVWLARDKGASAVAEPVAVVARHRADGSVRWTQVLDELGARRARAWRSDDPAGLREAYARGCRALRADRAMLASYQAHGLRLDAHVDFLRAHVLARRTGGVTLAVVDRLRPSVATDQSGGSVALPLDRPTAHTITLLREAGGWRIADIRPR